MTLFSPPPLHRPPLLTAESFRLHPAQHLAKTFILFQNPDVVNTVSPSKVEQHQGKNCLLVGPPLTRFSHLDMSTNTIANAQDRCQVKIDRKPCEGRHSRTASLFFVLVGKNTLCHNAFTSLVIVCSCQLILSSLFIRTNEVSIFLMAD